ncbi:39S ribosomal protein L27, mitochondrial [Diprion similis]|uniref:39S ribosomal protein L27, mitochondrial n=1 Tax=Diprion similis TaxID=362088 RepID=UPI001EF8DE26|nr:39S ribosomal protein L27, mitochondrial [Diprion similis]
MATLTNALIAGLQNAKQGFMQPVTSVVVCTRNASKKSGGSTRNPPRHTRPKHRGWRVQDGTFVQAGTMLATQLRTRFHPGLHVGFGRDGTLFALEAGRVMVTCEKIDPNWDHTWIIGNYEGRQGQVIYKKHFNVIPEPQHNVFKLVDTI